MFSNWHNRSQNVIKYLKTKIFSSEAAKKITTKIVRPDPLVAPFAKGQAVGSLKVSLGEQMLAEYPLLALDEVQQAGVFGRAWDALRLWIK